MAHTSPLPGVLNRISEDDVVSCDAQSAKLLNVVVNLGLTDGPKDGLTVGDPVGGIDEVRSHGVLCIWDLEPGELSAVLPCPLSHVVIVVHRSVGESHSIILIEGHSVLVCVLLKDGYLELHVSRGDA
jgi:hypothetical protein